MPDNRDADQQLYVGATRLWTTTRTQWYTLDAYLFWPSSGPFRGLAGFRYDSLATALEDPISQTDFTSSRPRDVGGLAVNSFIPYMGVTVEEGRGLRLGVIASPIVGGDLGKAYTIIYWPLEWRYWGSFRAGYFAEAWIDYGLSFRGGRLSFLAKWTCVHATGPATGEYTSPVDFGPRSNPYSASFDRQNWMLGGSFSIPWASPL